MLSSVVLFHQVDYKDLYHRFQAQLAARDTEHMQEQAAMQDRYEMELRQLRQQLDAVKRDGGVSVPAEPRPPPQLPSFRFGTVTIQMHHITPA